MAIPSMPTGQDPQSKWLWYILKELNKLTGISQSSVGGLTDTELRASAVEVNEPSLTDGAQKTQLVDSTGNALALSGEPRLLSCEYTRPSNTTARPAFGAVNETVSVIKELLDPTGKQAANVNGGGGLIINGSLASNNLSDAGRQFGIIFLREDITPIIADNAVQTILYENQSKRAWVVYTVLESQAVGSNCVMGIFNLPFEYVCKSDSKALKALIFDVTGGTTASGSKYTVTVNTQVNK